MKSIIIAAILVVLANSAQARAICDTRNNLVSQLITKHAESQTGFGLTITGRQVLELFTSKSGTWTILLTRPDGTSCAMAAGHSWVGVKPKPQRKSG